MFNYRVCREYYSFLYSVFGAENWPFVATLIGAILVVGGYYGTFCLIRRFFWDFEMGLPSSIVPLVIWLLYWGLVYVLWRVLTCAPFPWLPW